MEFTLLMVAAAVLFIVIIFFYYVPFFLWINALSAGVHISLVQLFLMRLRRVPPRVIVYAMIVAHKAGLKNVAFLFIKISYFCNIVYFNTLFFLK